MNPACMTLSKDSVLEIRKIADRDFFRLPEFLILFILQLSLTTSKFRFVPHLNVKIVVVNLV